MNTNYRVKINGNSPTIFSDLKLAIKFWNVNNQNYPGSGITIETYNEEGVCVREGTIILIISENQTYLNTNLAEVNY